MTEQRDGRRATVHDVARAAGVSLATVDRVLNGRPGVRQMTAERVEKAIVELDFRRDLSASLLARARDLTVRFLIPGGDNEFMASLEAAIRQRGRLARTERLQVDVDRVRSLDPGDLAHHLDALDPRTCDCCVIVATEDERVTRAVDAAGRRGISVMTLVSDLPGSSRKLFIGIDNVAAGRTAASLLGRFCGGAGKVGVIAGSLHLRDHRERLEGFRQVMAAEFAGIALVDPVETHDVGTETEQAAIDLLDRHPDLAGLYNLGAGNRGLMQAIGQAGRARTLHVVAHELSAPTREGLVSGAIDVVIDQDPDGEIRAAIAAARSLALGGSSAGLATEPIEIRIFLRDNLR